MKNIRITIFKKLFFPKTVLIDSPGLITSKTNKRFSSKEKHKRIIFDFEDVIADLYNDTVRAFGHKKTEELWYKVGKDVGTAYMSFSGKLNIPAFLIPTTLNIIFDILKTSGASGFDEIKYNAKTRNLILSGSDNGYCRKTQSSSMAAGLVSGILSYLLKQNIEAEGKCKDCPKQCLIIAKPKIKPTYVSNTKKLRTILEYNKVNPAPVKKQLTNSNSFSDLLKFKKIHISDRGKVSYLGNIIIPTSPEFIEIISYNYDSFSCKEILGDSVKNATFRLASKVFLQKEKVKKFCELQSLFSALGFGHILMRKAGKFTYLDLLGQPFNKYGYYFLSNYLEGFLEFIYEKNFQLKKIRNKGQQIRTFVYFECGSVNI
ncbi:MAG: hypothetical protein KKF44_09125 [Nanoarchaeota archaeon]|nr:hypothetical protein [Nanoarchaeota archaeon]